MRENRRDVTATFSSGGEAGMLERVSSGRGFRRDTNSHTMRGSAAISKELDNV